MTAPIRLRSHIGGAWHEGAAGELVDHNPARPDEIVARGLDYVVDTTAVESVIQAALGSLAQHGEMAAVVGRVCRGAGVRRAGGCGARGAARLEPVFLAGGLAFGDQ